MNMGPGGTITVIGEAMLELSRSDGDGWNLRYGGDVINTAVCSFVSFPGIALVSK